MAYQSLYRRYRPGRFAEVKGQEHVVRALRGAVRDDRVGHAYLFSGPRGTGKTSTARILAKALNCEMLADGEPCGTCEACRAIEAGTSYDLHELDAASNNGVEAIRDLISRASLGSPGRTKVYILDEVHMLSAGASNALLKTLEEPPPHVVFVLATTDPHKVLPTIRSRAQHYEFGLLGADELAAQVRWIIDDAGLDVDEVGVAHVLRVGGGSARDTLSALDQVVAAGGVPGAAGSIDALVEALCEGDGPSALVAVSDALAVGREPRPLAEELLGSLRDMFLASVGTALEHLTEPDRALARDRASRLGRAAIVRSLELVGGAIAEMRQVGEPRLPLEVALVRLTRPEVDTSMAALVERVVRLERALADGVAPPRGPGTAAGGAVAARAGRPVDPAPLTVEHAPAPGPGASGGSAGPGEPPTPSPGPAAPSAPPPDPRRGRRPADVAREALAESAAARGPDVAPSPSAPDVAPPGVGSGAPPDPVPPVDDAVPSGSIAGSSLDRVLGVWEQQVLPELSNRTRARYRPGRVVGSDGATVVVALPNAIHCQRCDELRPEVESALAERLGHPVTLRLVVEAEGDEDRAAASTGLSGPGRAAPVAPAPADDDEVDLTDLVDADGPAPSVLERIATHFPGAEPVEE